MSGELHAPEEITVCTHWVGSSVNPRDSLVALDNGEICRLYLKSDRESTVVQLLAKLLYQINCCRFGERVIFSIYKAVFCHDPRSNLS